MLSTRFSKRRDVTVPDCIAQLDTCKEDVLVKLTWLLGYNLDFEIARR